MVTCHLIVYLQLKGYTSTTHQTNICQKIIKILNHVASYACATPALLKDAALSTSPPGKVAVLDATILLTPVLNISTVEVLYSIELKIITMYYPTILFEIQIFQILCN